MVFPVMRQRFFIPVLAALALAVLLSGCPAGQPEGKTGTADKNAPAGDANAGQFPEFDIGDANTINIDLDQNFIRFNFRFSKSDTEILGGACKTSCDFLKFKRWGLKFNTAENRYFCLCSSDACTERIEDNKEVSYCGGESRILSFR